MSNNDTYQSLSQDWNDLMADRYWLKMILFMKPSADSLVAFLLTSRAALEVNNKLRLLEL